MIATIGKQYTFEAAHQIRNHPGKCRNLHGHSYKVIVEVTGEVSPTTGMVIDFDELDKVMDPVLTVVDHAYLNDIFTTIPTAENIAAYFFKEIALKIGGCSKVTVYETQSSFASYTP